MGVRLKSYMFSIITPLITKLLKGKKVLNCDCGKPDFLILVRTPQKYTCYEVTKSDRWCDKGIESATNLNFPIPIFLQLDDVNFRNFKIIVLNISGLEQIGLHWYRHWKFDFAAKAEQNKTFNFTDRLAMVRCKRSKKQ